MVGGCSESQKQGTGTQRKGGERQNEVGKQDKIPRQGEARQKVKWVDNKGERTDGEGERSEVCYMIRRQGLEFTCKVVKYQCRAWLKGRKGKFHFKDFVWQKYTYLVAE